MSKRVIVIGGGAAGMMAAIRASECAAAVTLLEPNERLGKKLNITGKGRCNVTNDSALEELMANIPCNAKFLYSTFSRFDGRAAMAFFEGLGVPLKVERGKRVFPVSDRSFDVSGALERRLRALRVLLVRDRALALCVENGRVLGVRGERGEYAADAVIVATGGVSYPATGSTGDGYRLAESVGHSIVPPRASLVPLESSDDFCAELQGLALKNVRLTMKNAKNRLVFDELGELLFTHFGISGPLVLSASAMLRGAPAESFRFSLDLKPALDEQKLEARLLRDFSERANQTCASMIGGLAPRSLGPVLLRRCGIPAEQRVNAVTREQRRALLGMLKCFPIAVSGTRSVAEAIVTSGGVKVGELDPKTMASKKCAGLYFAGEVIDVDGYTGGFNLQIAWATGRAAGEAAAK